MGRTYRLLYFSTRPHTSERFLIGAMVAEHGHAYVVRAQRLPTTSCLGSSARQFVLKTVLDRIENSLRTDILPLFAGPQFILDEQRQVPEDVKQVDTWLRKGLLPR